jgi:RNA polymerase sigma factor (sigma-70 family)
LRSNLWDCHVLQLRELNQRLRSIRLREAGCKGGRLGAWRRWHRERAIEERMPEVQRIARRVMQLFTHHIPLEDLEQSGYVGLVSAANTYDPRAGAFAAYAYWRVRGEMIDSQKRRTFREAANLSLQGIAEAHDGWLPPALDTCPRPLQDEMAEREEIHRILQRAITALPDVERRVLRGHLAGDSLSLTAHHLGRSLTWTRAKLAEARQAVGVAVRGEER